MGGLTSPHFYMKNTIKLFLKTKKPEALQVLMLNNNIEKDSFFDYHIVFADGFWFAWYNYEATKFIEDEVQRLELLRTAKK